MADKTEREDTTENQENSELSEDQLQQASGGHAAADDGQSIDGLTASDRAHEARKSFGAVKYTPITVDIGMGQS